MFSNDFDWPLMTCDCLPHQVPTQLFLIAS